MSFIKQKGVKKDPKPVRISFDKMAIHEGRRRVRDELKCSGMEESFRMAKAVDPDLKKTAEMLREFYYTEDDV